MSDDLRDWLQKADSIGKLKRIRAADRDLEIGTITDLNLKNGTARLYCSMTSKIIPKVTEL